jgi:spectinomycin phosphotransferase
VRERPPHVSDSDLLAEVRRWWDDAVDRVEHLPVGFGAHHWAAYARRSPRLFVTLDRLTPPRAADRLEAAYAGAVALHDAGLEFVLAPLPAADGRCTIPFAAGALSCTSWRDGESGGDLDVSWTATALNRLHAVDPPRGFPRWSPLVGPEFADLAGGLVVHEWGPGPYAERARCAIRDHLDDVRRWTARYHHLADRARDRPWVVTHGEPSSWNQLLTPDGRVLIDWESAVLAPAELDLRLLVGAGAEVDADREMLELFDLEWRLDEISQYAEWFAAPHDGTADDTIAFGGLSHELTRP